MYVLALRRLCLADSEVFRYCIVEFFLFRGKLVGNGFGVSFFVERTILPVFHIFLQTADEVLVDAALANLLDAGGCKVRCGKDVFVKQLHQAFEGVGTATVRRSCQQEDMFALL